MSADDFDVANLVVSHILILIFFSSLNVGNETSFSISFLSFTHYFPKIFSLRNFLISPEKRITIKGSNADDIIVHTEKDEIIIIVQKELLFVHLISREMEII